MTLSDHLVDETDLAGLRRADRLAGQGQFHGDVVGDAPGKAHQASLAREESPPDLRNAEAGGFGGNDQVAREHELTAATYRVSLDGGDQRLRRGPRKDPVLATRIDCEALAGLHGGEVRT